MNGSRSESVTHSNGHGAANGASEIETSRPKPPKLVDELAQAMGMGQETFERLRPAAAPLNAPPPPSQAAATTTLPAMPPPRNFFDDEDDDAAMPIPSTWRNPPEPPRVRGLSDQLRATGLGFATGLAIVVPAVLLMTGHLDNSSFSQLANMLPGSLVVSQDVQRTANETPRVQQRAVTTTTVAPQVVQSPAIVAVAPAPQPVLAAAPVAPAPEPAPVVASIAPAPEPAPAVTFVPTITAVEPPKPPVVAETAPAPTPPPVAEAPPVAAAPAPIASLAPAAPAPVMAPATTGNEIAEGKERFRGGDITGGRNVLARAAASGNAEAIMALAETYDPNMLAAWGIMAAAPDVTTARRLYAKARDSGLEIAETRLKGLE